MIGGGADEVLIIEGAGEEKGTSKLSELGMRNCIEDDGKTNGMEEDKTSGTSQNSPVYPAKHWQVKFSPSPSATQVPLLQSIELQISIGGLGLGETVGMKVEEVVKRISQNSPVYPVVH